MAIDRHHAFANGQVFPKPFLRKNKLREIFMILRNLPLSLESIQIWRQFSKYTVTSDDLLLGSKAWCVNSRLEPYRIQLEGRVVCKGLLRIEEFGNGKIIVHPEVYIGDDCLLSCADMIEIGSYTLIAHGVQIFDNDSHPLDWRGRQKDWHTIMDGLAIPREAIATSPIHIGQNVWIGLNSIILKGINIGDNSIIAAGSVITNDIPAGVIAGGNPARVIRKITEIEE